MKKLDFETAEAEVRSGVTETRFNDGEKRSAAADAGPGGGGVSPQKSSTAAVPRGYVLRE